MVIAWVINPDHYKRVDAMGTLSSDDIGVQTLLKDYFVYSHIL